MLSTDRQTDRQTNQRYQKHNLLCQGGNNLIHWILAAIKFGVSQNKVIWRLLYLASPRLCSVWSFNVWSRILARQILAKTRNSPNIIARQNLLIYELQFVKQICCTFLQLRLHFFIAAYLNSTGWANWAARKKYSLIDHFLQSVKSI